MSAVSLLLNQLHTVWKHFGPNQKVSIVLALVATMATVGSILYLSARPDYRLLYSGLTLEDAARARERLEDERIPVQLRNHGQAIYVPAADVYRGRLMLAQEGLPGDSSTGFELFEEPKFGLTEFAQQVNFQRALQGELERTIRSIEGVQSARVMLVMPRDRLFATERDRTGSASIMLNLQRGRRLDAQQVASISQLVMTSVPGLAHGQVTITDQQGRLLSDPHDGDETVAGNTRRQQDLRREVERELTSKAQDMLDTAIGMGQAIVRVSAELDFRQVERFNETYDADGRVVIRETISSENASEPITLAGAGMARVAVGSPADLTIEQAMGTLRREDIDTEYRVPSGRETVVDRGGHIKRLSVAVSVAEGDTPRDAEALQRIERMVRSAVGFLPERQDAIEVLEMRFAALPSVPDAEVFPWWERLPFSLSALLRTLAGMALLVGLYNFSKKVMRQLAVQREDVGTPISALAGGARAGRLSESGRSGEEVGQKLSDLDYIKKLAEQNPASVANWIDQSVKGNA